MHINGLFRHGWLLAPALVEQALADARWHDGEFAIDMIAGGANLESAGA